MQAKDRVKFAELMLGLQEYYKSPMSEAVINIYWNGLKDFEIESIDKAINSYLVSDTGQFMPKLSDLVKMIDGSSNDVAIVAWTELEKAMSRVGSYSSVVFADNITQAVIRDMGSWSYLCHKDIKELPFIAKEFQQRYRHYKVTNKPTQHPKVLVGLAEAQNQLQGLKSDPPVPIGDKDKARITYSTGSETSSEMLKISDIIKEKSIA